jgi:hypothetical protein
LEDKLNQKHPLYVPARKIEWNVLECLTGRRLKLPIGNRGYREQKLKKDFLRLD